MAVAADSDRNTRAMEDSFIVAGCPVRNRAWILPRHIFAVSNVAYSDCFHFPNSLFYLWGDCDDDTAMVLSRHRSAGAAVYIDRFDTGFPGWKRDGEGEERYHSSNMSRVRNVWAERLVGMFPEATHLWNVDSDVLPAPDVLQRLLAVDKPVVGAFVPIADGVTPIHMTHFVIDDPGGFKARRMGNEKDQTGPHPVTLLGGCYLIRRDAWEAGLRWGEHPQGEDGFFGDKSRELGLELWVDPMAKCEHVMEEDS